MNIAFCINKLALIGLGTALVSLVRNCSDVSELAIYILCADLSYKDKENINKILHEENFMGKITFIDFNPQKHFGNLRSLHGDWTTYGRLLLPELINEKSVLYLDSDIIIEKDVLQAAQIDVSNHAFAAVYGGEIKYSLEHAFYVEELCIAPDKSSFNAGILLFNLVKWREEKIKDKCLAFASIYPNKLLSCDQTILNALYAGNFSFLPQSFNCAWYANSSKPTISDRMIFHFVGSPKPWDIFGRYFHKGYNTWKHYLTQRWNNSYNKTSFKDLKRAWKIRRSYFKVIEKILLK